LALWSQGLVGSPPPGGVGALLRRLGAIQLDTISVLARAHELVPFSRLGSVGVAAVHRAYWGEPPRAFEYWGHLASVLPIESWPMLAERRRRLRSRGGGNAKDMEQVRRIIRDQGPITTQELGGARAGGAGWWNWSPMKVAVEALFNYGEVVCVNRRSWRRVYDLAERVIPAELLEQDPPDKECDARMIAMAGQRLGVGTLADLGNYWWMRPPHARAGIEGAGLVPVTVQGWTKPAWAHPAALAMLSAGGPRGRHRTTLLSPFDSLLWSRERVERIFGFSYRLEAFVPAPKRVHGYYSMPLLTDGRLRGRVDPAREGTALVARQLQVEPGAEEAMAAALVEAARWVGADGVRLERVDPTAATAGIAAGLRAAGMS
jgi:uncharacterized protein YcaQ